MASFKLLTFVLLASIFLSACEIGIEGPESALPSETRLPLDEILEEPITVTLDPNGTTPLAALAKLDARTATTVDMEVLGEVPVEVQITALDTTHLIPILGLYPGKENQIVFRMFDPTRGYAIDTVRITTGPLPDFLPDIEIVEADPSRMEEGWTFSTLSVFTENGHRTYPIMFDATGDIRWFMDLSGLGGIVTTAPRLANGNLGLMYGHSVYEYDMLGNVLNEWQVPGYWTHHEIVEKPDGNFILAVDKAGLETVEDHIVEIDRTSGAIVQEWDLRALLDVDRRDLMGSDQDWLHMNAIWYVESDDALIISGRNQGVVKITRDNELEWILAPHKGWGKAGLDGEGYETSEFLLTAVDAAGESYREPVQMGTEDATDFSWVWGQHAPMLLPNGNLFVFDNGLRRNFVDDGNIFNRGVEYEIDEQAMTVRQVWQYGKERGRDFQSGIISDVDYLPDTGNRLIMPGIARTPVNRAYVVEVTYPAGDVVFEARINFRNKFVTNYDGWSVDIVYRSERMPLYPTGP